MKSTWIVSPGTKRPSRRASLSGSWTSVWMTRRMWACAVVGVVAGVGDGVACGGGELEFHVLFVELGAQCAELEFDDFGDFFLGEAAEDHDAVEAVDEFGAEGLFEGIHDLRLHLLIFGLHAGLFIGGDGEADALGALDEVGADVAGHDEEGVAEVDAAALGVGEGAVLHDLEEHVEGLGVGFFDFVEEDDGVGAAADGFGELAGPLRSRRSLGGRRRGG